MKLLTGHFSKVHTKEVYLAQMAGPLGGISELWIAVSSEITSH